MKSLARFATRCAIVAGLVAIPATSTLAGHPHKALACGQAVVGEWHQSGAYAGEVIKMIYDSCSDTVWTEAWGLNGASSVDANINGYGSNGYHQIPNYGESQHIHGQCNGTFDSLVWFYYPGSAAYPGTQDGPINAPTWYDKASCPYPY